MFLHHGCLPLWRSYPSVPSSLWSQSVLSNSKQTCDFDTVALIMSKFYSLLSSVSAPTHRARDA